MRNTFSYASAFLIISLLFAQTAEAFWNKQEEPQDESSPKASGTQMGGEDNESQPFLDVGSDENVDRLTDKEAEELKTYVEEVQQHVQQTRDGTSAAQLSTEAKTVKDAMAAENPGLEDYETVRSLEPIQKANALAAVDVIQTTEPLNQARRIQDASNQAKRAAKLVPQKPAA